MQSTPLLIRVTWGSCDSLSQFPLLQLIQVISVPTINENFKSLKIIIIIITTTTLCVCACVDGILCVCTCVDSVCVHVCMCRWCGWAHCHIYVDVCMVRICVCMCVHACVDGVNGHTASQL